MNMIDVTLLIVMALMQTGGTENVGWSAPTHYTDGTAIKAPITYNLYRSHNGGAYTRVRTNVSVRKAIIVNNVVVGEVDCYKVTGTAGGAESAFSRADCITGS